MGAVVLRYSNPPTAGECLQSRLYYGMDVPPCVPFPGTSGNGGVGGTGTPGPSAVPPIMGPPPGPGVATVFAAKSGGGCGCCRGAVSAVAAVPSSALTPYAQAEALAAPAKKGWPWWFLVLLLLGGSAVLDNG